jgi:tetratricopeptide (TPR) repeat protein
VKSISYKILVTIVLAFVIIACSTKRDSLLSRKYHALTTEYNVLFNGQEAFDKFYLNLNKEYKDNFWEVLPIEPFKAKENNIDPNDKVSGELARAEEKAIKAIQKHSMYIGGQERNSQIDEAYLLLGKSRYYDSRFLPAIEAFNYVIYKSPEANTLDEIVVWKERSNIKLNNNEEAIANLKELLDDDEKTLKREVRVDANAVLAQAYYNSQIIDTTIAKLTIARNLTKDKEKKARFSFILGQLHKEFNQPDSAYFYFQEVIDMKRKANRMFTMQAYAQQATLFNYENGDTVTFLKKYDELLNDRENRPYLYILTHQLGNFYKHYHNYDKAITYYNLSIKDNSSKDGYLQASNYRELGQIKFDQRNYKASAKYYDSCLINMPDKTKEYLAIQRKVKNIGEVIKYEDIIAVADSTIRVYNMSEPERITYFTAHIDELKRVDTEKAIKQKEEEAKQANLQEAQAQRLVLNNEVTNRPSFNNAMPMPGAPPGADQSKFYYYVPASVQQGKLAFERKWGKRPLKDNWRWLNPDPSNTLASNETTLTDDVSEDEQELAEDESLIDLSNPKYDLQTYLDKVVKNPEVIADLKKNRNAAYYELGYIYDDKFGEYQLAADRLESLLNSNPEKGLVLPTLYNLYKIYNKLGSDKAIVYKNRIMDEYPDTHYAKVLQGIAIDKQEDPEAIYALVYKNYENNNDPVAALNDVNEKIDFYIGTPIIPKYELLKARLIAKNYGVPAYKEALENVVNLYPLTDEGKEALRILEKEIPQLESYKFDDKDKNQWKLIYLIDNNKKNEIESLEKTLQKYIDNTHSNNLKVSVDFYTPTQTLVVVHGFYSDAGARRMAMTLADKEYKVKLKGLPISLHNYIVVQSHKNLESYIELNK